MENLVSYTTSAAGAAAGAVRSVAQSVASMSAAVRPSATTPSPTDTHNGNRRTSRGRAPTRTPAAAAARSGAGQRRPQRSSNGGRSALTGLKGAVKMGATEVKGYAVEVLNQAMEARLVPMAVVLVLLLLSYLVGRLRRGKKKSNGSNSSNSPRGLSVSAIGSTSAAAAASAWSCAAAAASPRMYLASGGGGRHSAAAAAAAGYLGGGGDRGCLGGRDRQGRGAGGLRFQTHAAGVEHSTPDAAVGRRDEGFGVADVSGSGGFGAAWDARDARSRRMMSLVVSARFCRSAVRPYESKSSGLPRCIMPRACLDCVATASYVTQETIPCFRSWFLDYKK